MPHDRTLPRDDWSPPDPGVRLPGQKIKAVPRRIRQIVSATLQRLFPVGFARLKMRMVAARNFRCDARRFRERSGIARTVEQVTLQAKITMDYHRLEKGLSLREPRTDFGTKVAHDLIGNLTRYCRTFGADQLTATTLEVLEEYNQFRRRHATAVAAIEGATARLRREFSWDGSACGGGTIEISAAQVRSMSRIDAAAFFGSRHSVRDFTDEPVDVSQLETAVRMAQRTPSVCNRQAWRVHVARDPALKEKLLALQNGNLGFRSQIACALVVVCDLRHFVTVGERNQAWIDGGMFAMSLVYALHSLGLGTCFLNWSVTEEVDRKLRPLLQVTEHDVIITMLAVGHLPERFRVAHSQRKSIDRALVLED